MTRADWTPTPDDVAAVLGPRVGAAAAGSKLRDRIASLIPVVQREVLAACGGDGPVLDDDVAYAKDTVALGVARYIENVAFPEQNDVTTSGSAFAIGVRYTEHLAVLAGRVYEIPVA